AALIQRFVQGDAIDPCPQTGLALEAGDATENFDEDFLGDVGSVAGIRKDAVDEAVEGLLIPGDEPGKGFLRPRLELLNHNSFFGMNADDPCQIAHGRARHQNYSFSVTGK